MIFAVFIFFIAMLILLKGFYGEDTSQKWEDELQKEFIIQWESEKKRLVKDKRCKR